MASDMGDDLEKVLITKEEIDTRLREMAAQIDKDYEGKELLSLASYAVPSWLWQILPAQSHHWK